MVREKLTRSIRRPTRGSASTSLHTKQTLQIDTIRQSFSTPEDFAPFWSGSQDTNRHVTVRIGRISAAFHGCPLASVPCRSHDYAPPSLGTPVQPRVSFAHVHNFDCLIKDRSIGSCCENNFGPLPMYVGSQSRDVCETVPARSVIRCLCP